MEMHMQCAYKTCSKEFPEKRGKHYCSRRCKEKVNKAAKRKKLLQTDTFIPRPVYIPPNERGHTYDQIELPEYMLQPGVYFLYSGDELIYIGSTKHLLWRIGEHLRKKLGVTRICVIPCPVQDRFEMERYFIRKHRPRFNRVGINSAYV